MLQFSRIIFRTFEDVYQEAVWTHIQNSAFKSSSVIGRLFSREDEIDIVGLAPTDDRIVLAESK